jgi:hypothetical protein
MANMQIRVLIVNYLSEKIDFMLCQAVFLTVFFPEMGVPEP